MRWGLAVLAGLVLSMLTAAIMWVGSMPVTAHCLFLSPSTLEIAAWDAFAH